MEIEPSAVACAPRIGVTRAADKLLRFLISGSEFVSRRAPLERNHQGTGNKNP
jgi:3-methyladenine DNA glycosylase Mpg